MNRYNMYAYAIYITNYITYVLSIFKLLFVNYQRINATMTAWLHQTANIAITEGNLQRMTAASQQVLSNILIHRKHRDLVVAFKN